MPTLIRRALLAASPAALAVGLAPARVSALDRKPGSAVAIVGNFWREVWQKPQNPDAIDRLVTEAFATVDDRRREALAREAMALAMADRPVVLLHHQLATWAMRKDLRRSRFFMKSFPVRTWLNCTPQSITRRRSGQERRW